MISNRSRAPVLGLVALLTACTAGEKQTVPPWTMPTAAPDRPVLTKPIADALVVSPVEVAGQAIAAATITVDIYAEQTLLGSGSGVADSAGAFTVVVEFEDAARGADLEIRVTQRTVDGTSAPVIVSVKQNGPPAAPLVTQPEANADVASPLHVVGSGEAGVDVVVSVKQGMMVLASTESVVDSSGAFDVVVAYPSVADGTPLLVRAVLASASGMSDATEVTVVHRPRQLRGTISQTAGSFQGATVYVRLYDRADGVINPINEIQVAVAEGQAIADVPFEFSVADGRYFLRAYRDGSGPQGGPADGHPTIPYDAQSTASAPIVVAGGDSEGHAIALRAPFSTEAQFERFDVYTEHDSFAPSAPYTYDMQRGEWVQGLGLCGGFYLRMTVEQRVSGNIMAPRVRTPSGAVVSLLDDGGCGERGDNRAESYDDRIDGRLSFGIKDPSAADAGVYTMFYFDAVNDQIHEAVDDVSSIQKLARNRPLTAPTGSDAAGIRPTLRWAPIPGAAAYTVRLDGANGTSQLGSPFVSAPEWTPDSPLVDDAYYRATIEAFDVDPAMGADVDAHVRTVTSFFVTDAAEDSSIVVSGSITNNSGAAGPILLFAEGDFDPQSSAVLPAASTTYALRFMAGGRARVTAFIDVDGGGDPNAPNTKAMGRSFEVDASGDVTYDIVFTAPLILTAPVDGATQTGPTPRLSWADYRTNGPSTPWSYAVYAAFGEFDGFPPVVWGLPNTATSFDFASPNAERFDVVYMASCFESGGTYANGACSGGSPESNVATLAEHSQWQWGVVVLPCDFADNNYAECLMGALGDESGFYAQSQEWRFSID